MKKSILNNNALEQFRSHPFGTWLSDWLNTIDEGPEKKFVLDLLRAAQNPASAAGIRRFRKLLEMIRLQPAPQSSKEFGKWIGWEVFGGELTDRKVPIDSWWLSFGTGDAIAAVIEVWQRTQAQNILQCPCGNWFQGRFKRSKYCGVACQLKFGRETEDFKAKHREYMREYQRRRRAEQSPKKRS
jgi:hypothetical protein